LKSQILFFNLLFCRVQRDEVDEVDEVDEETVSGKQGYFVLHKIKRGKDKKSLYKRFLFK
jgi:hypothetical protein